MMDDHEALAALLRDMEARCGGLLRCMEGGLHGMGHLREVAMLAGRIAMALGQDAEPAMVAGLLHDCARVDDGGGNRHAIDSAQAAEAILREKFPHLDAPRICDAIARHADGQTTDDPLAGALWDADRLTLVRLSRTIRLDLLSTDPAKAMAEAVAQKHPR
ncbi:MAG: HD domain-containing protein [Planctomycetota bacterium]